MIHSDIQALLPAGSFHHSCIVVADIQKTYDAYAGIPGAQRTPLTQTAEPEIAKVVYRGKGTPAVAGQFFVTVGGLSIEALSPDEHPSVWAEGLARCGGDCLHHVGFHVDQAQPIIDAFAERGVGVLQTGNYPGGRYTYLDTQGTLGTIIELLENV